LTLDVKGTISKEATDMKIVATFMAVAFVLATGTSLAFGACAGHSQAQMVKTQTQDQMSKDRPQPTENTLTVAEKAADPAKSVVQTPEKK
jgi:hypothetical protein